NDPDCTNDTACEACCAPSVSCYEATPADCSNAGGTPQGSGSDCLGLAACCKPGGTCLFVDEQCCDYEGGTSLGSGSDCDPNLCCVVAGPTQPAGEAGFEKIRYFSTEPGNPGRLTALRVTMTTIPPPYSGFSGTRCWVGEPAAYCENAGKPTPPCPTAQPTTEFLGAGLQGTPHCMDWSTVGVLHVSDDDIVPNAVYDVQAIDCECDFGDETNYSAPLTITTSRWGDLVRNCAVYPCGPPDGTVGIPGDVTAVLDKFKNLGPPAYNPAVIKSRADLDWNIPNRRVDISDVTFCLDAFRGFPYPPLPPAEWPGPNGCP
ncbi:MAG: hypothetical protein JSU86_04065, partial [Phycisphaerales bacterium]